MRYYISDLHFFHENLNTRMDKRGFATVEEMHEYMITKWNEKVRKKDEVVILGDVGMGKPEEMNQLLSRLQGKLYLIEGNHDKFIHQKGFDASRFEWVHGYKELSDSGRKVVLSHYPILCYNGQYRISKSGDPKAYMLYGHVHDTYDEVLINSFLHQMRASTHISPEGNEEPVPCNMINCFCMFSDYQPLSLDEWIVVDRERRAKMRERGGKLFDQKPD